MKWVLNGTVMIGDTHFRSSFVDTHFRSSFVDIHESWIYRCSQKVGAPISVPRNHKSADGRWHIPTHKMKRNWNWEICEIWECSEKQVRRGPARSRFPSKALLGTDLFPTHNGVVSARTAAARLSLVPCRAPRSQLQMERKRHKKRVVFSWSAPLNLQVFNYGIKAGTCWNSHLLWSIKGNKNHGTPYRSCWSGSNFHNLGRWWTHSCPMST